MNKRKACRLNSLLGTPLLYFDFSRISVINQRNCNSFQTKAYCWKRKKKEKKKEKTGRQKMVEGKST